MILDVSGEEAKAAAPIDRRWIQTNELLKGWIVLF